MEKKSEKTFEDVLRMFAPGTSLRMALDDLLGARMGALLVFENDQTEELMEKGFRINAKFSAQKLVELAKMDGAIILSGEGKRILYANALLVPDVGIPTKETGTRHKASERTAKQANAITIAVSERKNKISLYYGDIKYELARSSEILRRAAETLQILEKQKEDFDDLLNNFNVLEISNLVTIKDVCRILQKLELVQRISDNVRRYLIELGKEGMIVSMRLKELTSVLPRERGIIFRDYFDAKSTQAQGILNKMNFDFLLEISNISRMLFEELHDKSISPRGIRVLGKTGIPEKQIDKLIGNFRTLDKILSATEQQLVDILESEESVQFFKEEIYNLKEKIMVGKKL